MTETPISEEITEEPSSNQTDTPSNNETDTPSNNKTDGPSIEIPHKPSNDKTTSGGKSLKSKTCF